MKNSMSIEELEILLESKRKTQRLQDKKQIREIKLKKKMSFSERLILIIIMMSWVAIVSAVHFSFRFETSDVWSYILDTVKWLSGGTTAFYLWKAKSENAIKIKNNPNYDLEEYANQLLDKLTDDTTDTNY